MNVNAEWVRQANAALMYDAISVLAEAFGKVLRKKPDFFVGGSISTTSGGAMSTSNNKTPTFPSSSSSSTTTTSFNTTMREVHCATGRDFTDSPVPFELGEKISKFIRKVSASEHKWTFSSLCPTFAVKVKVVQLCGLSLLKIA